MARYLGDPERAGALLNPVAASRHLSPAPPDGSWRIAADAWQLSAVPAG